MKILEAIINVDKKVCIKR